ncbi:hypothetical protein [Streptomyces sp. NBC_00459]|uniref:hypothetical protein n=1 Tax=Streptomyces sp. NBC_00459 TaxID=2975749 RepID=UPI002E17716A
MTTRTKITGAVLGAVLAGSAALVPFVDDARGQHESRANDILIAESKDAIPSTTGTDWVSYGDHAAVVQVTAEHEMPADEEEIAAGEGYLSRTVDLDVKERVWSRAGVTALPSTLTIVADGWSFKGDTKTRVGSHEASRLEVGHNYLVSLAHFSDGEWSTLGTGGILPYDNSEIGQGEYEGSTVSATAYRAVLKAKLVSGSEEPLAYRAAASKASSVKTFLTNATPDPTAAANYNLDAVARAKLVYKAALAAARAKDTFCSVAAPLATAAGSKYTPGELSDILVDLAGMSDTSAEKWNLTLYAAQLRSDTGSATTWTGSGQRGRSATQIEQACTIDVGNLLPNDTGDTE